MCRWLIKYLSRRILTFKLYKQHLFKLSYSWFGVLCVSWSQIFAGCVVETGKTMDQSIMNAVVINPIQTLLTSQLVYRLEKRSRNIFSISKGYVIIRSKISKNISQLVVNNIQRRSPIWEENECVSKGFFKVEWALAGLETYGILNTPTNYETLLRKNCFPKCFPIWASAQHSTRKQKVFLNFFQKHFTSVANVSSFVRRGNNFGKQCVLNNVSLFARALDTSWHILLKGLK